MGLSLLDIDGISTEVYSVVSTDRQFLNPILIVIPGNPGLIQFYRKFVDFIYKKLEEKCSIYAVGHAGHGAVKMNSSRIFSLEEQITHKIRFMQITFDLRKQNFIIISHSVGSYISLKLLKRCSDTIKIVQVINLFPTFRNLWEGLNFAKKCIAQPIIRNGVASLLHYTPSWILGKIAHVLRRPLEEIQYVTEGNFDYYVVMNVLCMTDMETKEICSIDDEVRSVIEEHFSRLFFLYGPLDRYAPKSYCEELKAMFPQVRTHLAPEYIEHAFVLSYSEEVALLVVQQCLIDLIGNRRRSKEDLQIDEH
jgi:pimeloyl-ACP methyl ester carboxylesterase